MALIRGFSGRFPRPDEFGPTQLQVDPKPGDTPTQAPIVSETLVIKPENQKDITRENQNRNVRFLIPNYVGYFLPSQSNFSFSITMEGRGNPIPSRDAGLHSLFNVVRTYDVTNSHLLEEVIQYNTLVAQKYQYSKTTSVDNYRAEFEGVQPNKSIDQNLYWKPDTTTYASGTVVAPDVAKSVQFSGTIKTDFGFRFQNLSTIDGIKISPDDWYCFLDKGEYTGKS